VTTTSACVDRHVLPALFSTQFVNKVYEFKTPFVKWKQIFEKMCENNEENIPPEVFEAARKATLNLLPQKSRQQGCVQKSYPGAPRSPCAVRKLPVMQTWSSVKRSELFG
jgi:hypothetical protein